MTKKNEKPVSSDSPELAMLVTLTESALSVDSILSFLDSSKSPVSETTVGFLRGADYHLKEAVQSLCRDCPDVARCVKVISWD